MRIKIPALVGLLTLSGAFAYAVYPYVTLYRISVAIKGGDSATLASLVDWNAVREGIKEDICDAVLDLPARAVSAPGKLPPFGASFMRGIASSKIDDAVTPEAIVAAASNGVAAANKGVVVQRALPAGGELGLGWAYFSAPTEFTVSLTGTDPTPPVKLTLQLRHGTWQVTRVWLPSQMLDGSQSRV